MHIVKVCLSGFRVYSNRVSPKALERLEPGAVKVARRVLRGACELVTVLWGGNTPPRLPDYALICREMKVMKIVYILQHVHTFEDQEEDVKFIGVYSSYENAEDAISRLSQQPGFQNSANGFCIDKYELDKDHWIERYVTIEEK